MNFGQNGYRQLKLCRDFTLDTHNTYIQTHYIMNNTKIVILGNMQIVEQYPKHLCGL